MKAILFVLLAITTVIATVGCTVYEDDPDGDTTIVKPDDKPDIIITPPAAENKP